MLEGLSTDAHHGLVLDLGIFGVDLVFNFQPLVFREQLLVLQVLVVAGIQHHVAVEVNDLLHIPQGHVQQDGHVAGDPLQVPDVGDGCRQLDEAHAVTTHAALGDLHTAAFTNDAPVTHPFVLTAVAFPVFGRAKNLFAEQPVHLGLEGAVVDGLRLGDLTDNLAVGQGALSPLHHPIG